MTQPRVNPGPRSTSVLLDNKHYLLDTVRGARIIIVRRKAVPFVTKVDVDASCGAVMKALDDYGRETSCVYIDSRAAQGRNDPDFDSWFARYRRGMLLGFVRSAVLVETAVGKLHCDRLLRDDGQDERRTRAFVNEVALLAWLRAGLVLG